MCLRCLINDKTKFIESQASQIADLQYKNDKLIDEVEYLKDELKIILERKEYYKERYYRDKQ